MIIVKLGMENAVSSQEGVFRYLNIAKFTCENEEELQ